MLPARAARRRSSNATLAPLLRHGILRERFAADVTDAVRAQLLGAGRLRRPAASSSSSSSTRRRTSSSARSGAPAARSTERRASTVELKRDARHRPLPRAGARGPSSPRCSVADPRARGPPVLRRGLAAANGERARRDGEPRRALDRSIEYSGHWPYDPLDADASSPARCEHHVTAQLERLPRSRLLLVRQPGRARREHVRLVYGSTPERGGGFRTLDARPPSRPARTRPRRRAARRGPSRRASRSSIRSCSSARTGSATAAARAYGQAPVRGAARPRAGRVGVAVEPRRRRPLRGQPRLPAGGAVLRPRRAGRRRRACSGSYLEGGIDLDVVPRAAPAIRSRCRRPSCEVREPRRADGLPRPAAAQRARRRGTVADRGSSPSCPATCTRSTSGRARAGGSTSRAVRREPQRPRRCVVRSHRASARSAGRAAASVRARAASQRKHTPPSGGDLSTRQPPSGYPEKRARLQRTCADCGSIRPQPARRDLSGVTPARVPRAGRAALRPDSARRGASRPAGGSPRARGGARARAGPPRRAGRAGRAPRTARGRERVLELRAHERREAHALALEAATSAPSPSRRGRRSPSAGARRASRSEPVERAQLGEPRSRTGAASDEALPRRGRDLGRVEPRGEPLEQRPRRRSRRRAPSGGTRRRRRSGRAPRAAPASHGTTLTPIVRWSESSSDVSAWWSHPRGR